MPEVAGPDTPSSDHLYMQAYWTKARTVLAGQEAMRAAGERYLPKNQKEQQAAYDRRLKISPYTNIYGDIVSDLAAKPFAEEVSLLEDGATDALKDLAEDIDGAGNNIHVFAENVFYAGLNYAVDWILVEHSKPVGQAPRTVAEEREQGMRPYWVRIAAEDMLEARTEMVRGERIFVRARFRENAVEVVGFKETVKERIRYLYRDPILVAGRVVGYAPARYRVYEKTEKTETTSEWAEIDAGPISLGLITLVPFATGRRQGNTWRFDLPMQGALDEQIRHFQAQSGLAWAMILACYPMLAAEGIDIGGLEIEVGPHIVLNSPPGVEGSAAGVWKFVEPQATSLKFMSDEIDKIEKRLRELGRQPMTAQTPNLTVVMASQIAMKANSAVGAWALKLKDALELALKYTAMWLGQADVEPQVRVHTDFTLESGDEKGPEWLRDMAKRGRLSTETEWAEAKRRNVLSADFDAEKEPERIALEAEGLEPEDEEEPAEDEPLQAA